MSRVGTIYAELLAQIGDLTDAASTTGSALAKAKALGNLMQGTTQVGTALKNGAALAQLPSAGSPATVYTWSNWQQIDAAVASAGIISHALVAANTDDFWTMQVGVGGVGAESAIWAGAMLGKRGAQDAQPMATGLIPPKVANGARVCIRFTYGGTPGSVSLSAEYGATFQATPV